MSNRCIRNHTGRRAFTIPEVLTVIAIIIIILAMLLPSLGESRHGAWMAMCASNQHQCHIAMKGQKGYTPHSSLPSSGAWTSAVVAKGAGPSLICPVDEFIHRGAGGMDDLRIVQWEHSGHPDAGHVSETMMVDIIDGASLPDPQISWFRGDRVHRGGQLNGEDDLRAKVGVSDWSRLESGKVAVSIDWSGRFLIDTNDNTIHIYDKWQGDPHGGGSRHFIYDSEGELVEIGGGKHTHTNNQAHQGYDPALDLDAEGTAVSFGMNSQVRDKRHGAGQVLLLDYERSIVQRGDSGHAIDDMDELFAPRHFGKANVLFVDGSVQPMAQAELEVDPELWLP